MSVDELRDALRDATDDQQRDGLVTAFRRAAPPAMRPDTDSVVESVQRELYDESRPLVLTRRLRRILNENLQRRQALLELRLAALLAIRDTERYSHVEYGYEHESDIEDGGLANVDSRVAALITYWKGRATRTLPTLDRQQRHALSLIRWCAARLTGHENAPLADDRFDVLARHVESPVSVQDLRLPYEADFRDRDRETRAHNDVTRLSLNPELWVFARALNDYRTVLGRPRLKISFDLVVAAHEHCHWMADHERLVHIETDAATATPAARARLAGFAGKIVGENVGAGMHSALAVHTRWLRNADEHRNRLSVDYTHIGVAFADGYWTEMLAVYDEQLEARPAPMTDADVDAE